MEKIYQNNLKLANLIRKIVYEHCSEYQSELFDCSVDIVGLNEIIMDDTSRCIIQVVSKSTRFNSSSNGNL